MTRDEVIGAVTLRAAADARVQALFLGGSLGAGTGDAWSDVDLIAVVAPKDHAGFVEGAEAWVGDAAPLAFWRRTFPGVPLFMGATEDWVRLDLTVTVPGMLTGAKDRWRALYDPSGLWAGLPDMLGSRPPSAEQVEAAVVEFLRCLALAPVALGREEYAVAVTGAGLLRGQLIALMLMDRDLPQPPGALHLSRLLPPEDMAAINALPCPEPTRQSILAFNAACAAAFLPRARRLAARVGVQWPERVEAAARAHLERTLGFRWA